MDHFAYRSGRLFAEDVPIETIADAVGTPVYVYSTATLRPALPRLRRRAGGDWRRPSATRSRRTATRRRRDPGAARRRRRRRLRRRARDGARRRRAGGAHRLLRRRQDRRRDGARRCSPACCRSTSRSEPELELLDRWREHWACALRPALRVNPDVDAHTHDKISTGRREDKFGIEWTAGAPHLRRAAALPGI